MWLLEETNATEVIDGANIVFERRKLETQHVRGLALSAFEHETRHKLEAQGRDKAAIDELLAGVMEAIKDPYSLGTGEETQQMIREKLGVTTVVPPAPGRKRSMFSSGESDELPEYTGLLRPLEEAVKHGHVAAAQLLLEAKAANPKPIKP